MSVIDAAYGTVHDYPGGASALAGRFSTRSGGVMSPAVLNSKVDPRKDSHHLTLGEADQLMAFTEDYRILHQLAMHHGHVCIRVNADVPSSDLAILELVTAVWEHNGDVGREVNAALADGRIDQSEVERVKRAIYRVQLAMQQMVMRLDGMKG
ncbi:MAG: hypothetical protein HYZ18_00760 [Pseudogulbenkiania sp.]|nr:hypothetical protein [Pseudogulbenkiania sp.]